jgi:ATP-dependent Clp protease ATP-binding subunit ClpA
MVRANALLDPTRTGRDATELKNSIGQLIVGQDEAVEQIINIYQMHLIGLNPPGRPVGTFLFLGPTGTGKTRIVEAAAECMLKNPNAVIKIDCGEFQHSHEIAKLIGSPPGYLGHRETRPVLSQETLNQYHTEDCRLSFVLFDEIEKASDALWNLLLGILDKASLTLGDNRKVDFSRTMIFMTSNVGATEMSGILNPRLGFFTPKQAEIENGQIDAQISEKIAKSGVEAARRKFPPEFVNRADKVVVFKPLGQEHLRRVLDIELNMVQQRVFHSAGAAPFLFTATGAAKTFLLNEGTDVRYGARPLKRTIEKLLVHPMSNLIATGQVRGGDVLRIDFDDAARKLVFLKAAEGMAAYDMHRMPLATISAVAEAVGGRPHSVAEAATC